MKPRRSGCRRSCRGQRGAALLLFLIVFLTVGLAMLFRDKPSPESLRFAQDQRTEQALMQARAALIGYAARYRDLPGNASETPGHLPCPDFDNDGFAEANCGAQDETVIGRLPYRTMGLPDLRDAAGECLWYVVSGSHKNSPKSAAPMNWDSRGHIRIDDLAGNVLAAPDDANGGVVMAIIAPGVAAIGQNRPGGTGACSGDNNNTVADYLDSPWDTANAIRIVADRYQQAKASSTAAPLRLIAGQRDSNTNNDGVSWVTARELFAPIAKRGDLLGANAATNLMARLKLCLDAQATLPVPATDPAAAHTAFASMTAIRLGDAVFPVINANYPRSIPPPPVCSWSNEFDNLWAAWRDHIRYVACTTASGRCLTVNGQSCKGALIFAGARADGAPRTATERNPAFVDTGNVNDRKTFLDGPNWSSFTTGTTGYSGGLAYDPKSPAGDIVLGLQCFSSVTTNTDPGFADLAATAVSFPSNLTMVRLDSATRTLTLGSENLQASAAHPAASLFGCAWFGTPIPFGNGIRAFFKYVVREKGNGFVLTLADAAVDRNPGTTMCGAAGMHLGYSGTGGKADPTDPATAIVNGVAVAPIVYPKIGLEIDLRQHDNFSEPIDLEDSGRNDLTGTPHAAIVFWGHHDNNAGPPAVSAPGWDDNVHGLPATGNVQAPYVSPQNPPYSNQTSGIDGLRVRSFLEEEGSDHPKYVRLEIDRSAITGGHRYAIRVWLSGGNRNSLDDLTRSYTSINPTTAPDLTTTRDIFNVPGASTDALSNIRVGFTNAAGDDDQEIDVTEFTLRGVD